MRATLLIAGSFLLAACAAQTKPVAPLPPAPQANDDSSPSCELSVADALSAGAVKMTDKEYTLLKAWMSDAGLPTPPADIGAYIAKNSAGGGDILFSYQDCITIDLPDFSKDDFEAIFHPAPKDPGI